MKKHLMFLIALAITSSGFVFAESYPNKTTIDFDKVAAGQLPEGWFGGVTGKARQNGQ